jgi:transketolase
MRTIQNPREVYGNVLLRLAKANRKIVALDADLCKSTMTCKIEEELPEQYFEMGIGEQNMMSVAGGLSLTGHIPFVNSFAIFLTSRAFDQIRQAIGISKLNVKIIGSSAGLSDFGDGSTHQTVEDISIMRSIPGMTVIVPSDANELQGAIEAITAYHGPVYLRYSRNNMHDINPPTFNFTIGEIYPLHEGKDITVFCIGDMVLKTLNVAEELKKEGIGVNVVNVPTIKPLDREKIIFQAEKTGRVITVEEHSIIGGLGSAVAEALRLEAFPLEFVGINDSYGKSGHSHQELLEEYGLTESHIKSAIYKMLKIHE